VGVDSCPELKSLPLGDFGVQFQALVPMPEFLLNCVFSSGVF
jgi:hypothetical protein